MNRRAFLTAGAGLGLLASVPGIAQADGGFNYTPELLKSLLDSGEPVLIGFHATWCTTCRTQERVIKALMEENADYEKVHIITVNWDEHKRSNLVKALRIPRRSTLVMFNEGDEVGRVIAQTSPVVIEKLFQSVI